MREQVQHPQPRCADLVLSVVALLMAAAAGLVLLPIAILLQLFLGVLSDQEEEEFVMVPWYRRSGRRAPRGNLQLEAGLDRMKAYLVDPANKRRVRDNMTPEQRQAMMELRNLPNTSKAQVVFEDKGNRFVVRDLKDQDNQIKEKLEDRMKFDH